MTQEKRIFSRIPEIPNPNPKSPDTEVTVTPELIKDAEKYVDWMHDNGAVSKDPDVIRKHRDHWLDNKRKLQNRSKEITSVQLRAWADAYKGRVSRA